MRRKEQILTDVISSSSEEDSDDEFSSSDNECLAHLVPTASTTVQCEDVSDESEDTGASQDFSWTKNYSDPIKYTSSVFSQPLGAKE